MMYPKFMFDPNSAEKNLRAGGRLVKKARDEYNAGRMPIEVQRRETDDYMAPSFSLMCFSSMSLLTQNLVLRQRHGKQLLQNCSPLTKRSMAAEYA